MQRFEDLVRILTGLVFVASLGLVLVLPEGLNSGVPQVAVESDQALEEWLGNLRGDRVVVVSAAPPPPLQGLAGPGRGSVAQPAAKAESAPSFSTDEVPASERVFPSVPWLRRTPGVAYYPTRRISGFVKRKYESFADAFSAAQAGGGRFGRTAAGDSVYELTWVQAGSSLGGLGLLAGDRILAVNGHPLGQSMESGQALYEALKGSERFAIMIERGGRRVVLSYEVR